MESTNERLGPITIVVAVAVRLYREGLASTLGAHGHLRVEASAATPAETKAAARDVQPHVIIVDVAFNDVCGLMRTLRVECSNSRILAFAVREDITAILEYASAGADGFATSNSSVADLVNAIERTAAGELLCSPQMAAQLLRAAAVRTETSSLALRGVLTGREHQVLTLLNQGRSNKEIANALNISPATVKNHARQIAGHDAKPGDGPWWRRRENESHSSYSEAPRRLASKRPD
jgi:two-component system, NarL family, nitrate/nitrite response regulator NarL